MRKLCLTVWLLALPSFVSAQEFVRRVGPAVPAAAVNAPALPAAALAASTADAAAVPEEGPSLARHLLTAVGGAAVGAWVGFMASQVMVGDWDERPGIRRENWAAGGAVAGLTLSLALPVGRSAPGRASRPEERRPSRDRLTGQQVRETRASSLYEAIRSLRPEWLRPRGTGSMRETPRGTAGGIDPAEVEVNIQPGIPSIRVYLDDSFMGDISALRTVDTGMVGDVQFLDAAAATQRWGAGHLHGAILIRTSVPR